MNAIKDNPFRLNACRDYLFLDSGTRRNILYEGIIFFQFSGVSNLFSAMPGWKGDPLTIQA